MFKIGIVGAGIMIKDHINGILKNENCQLTMVADIDIEKAKEAAKETGAIAYVDYHDFCKDPDNKPDVVIVNLPHFLHKEVTIYFLENKVNVLVEKPMAMNKQECLEMIEAAKKNGVKLGVGHVQQYFGSNKRLKEIIDSNRLGKLIRMIETRNADYFTGRPKWFVDKKYSGGGMIMNYGAHTLDRIFYLTGKKLIKTHSVISNNLNDCTIEEGAQILAEFSDDFSAAISYSGCEHSSEHIARFYFTKGIVMVTGNKIMINENKEWTEEIYDNNINVDEIKNMILWLSDKENSITAPEHGMQVIEGIEMIYAEGNI